MTAAKGKQHDVKVFIMRASDVLEKLLPAFDQKTVFVNAKITQGGIEQIMQAIPKVTVPSKNKAILDSHGKLQLSSPVAPPSGVIHYFRWGTFDTYSLQSHKA